MCSVQDDILFRRIQSRISGKLIHPHCVAIDVRIGGTGLVCLLFALNLTLLRRREAEVPRRVSERAKLSISKVVFNALE